MHRFPRPPVALGTFALSAVLAVACASRPRKPRPAPPSTGADVVFSSAGWLNPDLERPSTPVDYGARAATSNAALRPDSPWIGTFGLKDLLAETYEVGAGVCVPTPFSARTQSDSATDRARELGVGVWIRWDF
jgi:hypothetical protein